MKAAIHWSILIAASAAATMSHAINEIDAVSICGELGVMKVNIDELPEGVSLEDVRLCADHPLGRDRSLDPSDGASIPPEYMEIHHLDME